MSRRPLLPVVIALAAGVALWYGARLARSSMHAFGIGAPAPSFQAITLDAPPSTKGLADIRSGVTLLNLWATWCEPCKAEMPSIERLYGRYRDRGLRVVAVSVDSPGFEQAIKDFIAEYALTFDVWYDASGDIQRSYRSRGIPSTYIIGRDGLIRLIRQGAVDWDAQEHRALVERLLADRP